MILDNLLDCEKFLRIRAIFFDSDSLFW